MGTHAPSGADRAEAEAFLARYPDLQAIDIILTDSHGIGRGKTLRRHELAGLYASGRGMPASLFGQDVAGDDVEGTGLVLTDGGGDMRCWPVPGTLGRLPCADRGQVLVSMYDADGVPFGVEPRHALARQVGQAGAAGLRPMGALELEFYLIDRTRDAAGHYRPAAYALTGRRPGATHTMSVDELDEMSPVFDAIYAGAEELGVPLETVISEYAVGQYEFTLRYRDLMRAADDVVIAKRLIRATARRFGMEACFMAKPFGAQAGSGMHLHLSLAGPDGENLFADTAAGDLSPLMLQAIAGIRATIPDTLLVLAPFLNSWRRFAVPAYSPACDSWGVENRTVALRVPSGAPHTRHFEHRVAGVDANPYLVAAVSLAGALDGIAHGRDPGPPASGNGYAAEGGAGLPRTWLEAIDRFEAAPFARQALGARLHAGFVAMKRAEWLRFARAVSEAEWELYGFVV